LLTVASVPSHGDGVPSSCPEFCDPDKRTGDRDPVGQACCIPTGNDNVAYATYHGLTCAQANALGLGGGGTDCASAEIEWEADGESQCTGNSVENGGHECPLETVPRTLHYGLFCEENDAGIVECKYLFDIDAPVRTTVCRRCPTKKPPDDGE
jgi:hypothetical protein